MLSASGGPCMQLWSEWYRCVRQLRTACSRSRTFLWLVLALAGLSNRCARARGTSFVRSLALKPAAYRRLLHLFHCSSVDLGRLTHLWARLGPTVVRPLRAAGRPARPAA